MPRPHSPTAFFAFQSQLTMASSALRTGVRPGMTHGPDQLEKGGGGGGGGARARARARAHRARARARQQRCTRKSMMMMIMRSRAH